MRILYVITAAEFGGAPHHVIKLMEHMVEQGHAVGLVAAPEPRLMEEAEKLEVSVFPNPHFVGFGKPVEDIKSLWGVYQAIKSFKPDLVHAHSTKAGFAARLCCFILRFKPVLFTAHGWAFTEGRPYWKRWLLAQAERLAARATTRIICVSEHDRELALQFGVARQDKLVVVHNGITPWLPTQGGGARIRRGLGLQNTTTITFVGRLVPQKDVLTLLSAMKDLPNGKLLMIGDGELRPQVEDFIHQNELEDRVVLLGTRYDVPDILADSDIFVLPSRWEGLPYVVIEASMAGLPVVATRVGGIPELVEDGVTGFLVPPGNPEALSEAIQRLLDNKDLRHQMGRAGREKALREFTSEHMLVETDKVYEGVAGSEHTADHSATLI